MALAWVEYIGFAAALLTTIAFVPQAIKAIRTKHTKDVSLPMLILMTTGVALWLVYGLLVHSWPLIAANVPTTIIAIITLVLKIRYG